MIAGFTTGIGVMILSGQVPKALGLPIPAGLGAIEVLQAVAQSLGSVKKEDCRGRGQGTAPPAHAADATRNPLGSVLVYPQAPAGRH